MKTPPVGNQTQRMETHNNLPIPGLYMHPNGSMKLGNDHPTPAMPAAGVYHG